jgi:hypothetical protein
MNKIAVANELVRIAEDLTAGMYVTDSGKKGKLTTAEFTDLVELLISTERVGQVSTSDLRMRSKLESKATDEELIEACDKAGVKYSEIYD